LKTKTIMFGSFKQLKTKMKMVNFAPLRSFRVTKTKTLLVWKFPF